ncbi:MAG: invasion associated locus B family protein [Pseudomonadota bacterium]
MSRADRRWARGLIFGLLMTPVSGHAQTLSFPEPISQTPFQDWLVECFETPRAANDCQAFQRVTMNNGTAIAMVVTFAYITPEQLEIQMALPLGLDITQGARFAVGPDYTTTVPINRCTQQGCLVEGAVGVDLAAKFQSGEQATVTVVVPGRGDFQVPFSLNGLNEALATIRPQAPEAAQTDPTADQIVPPQDTRDADTSLAPVTGGN